MHLKKAIFIYLFFCFLFFSDIKTENILLQSPQLIDNNNLQVLDKSWEGSFGRHGSDCTFFYENGNSAFIISLQKYVFNSLSKKSQSFFILDSSTGCYTYTFGVPNKVELIDDTPDYYVRYPRDIYEALRKPRLISLDECKQLFNEKRIVFYTGAGISAKFGLTMGDLMSAIQFKEDFVSWINQILVQPELIHQNFSQFCHKAFEISSTPAHDALRDLAFKKQCAVITENFDLLHERSGIHAWHFKPGFHLNIDPLWMKEIDVIVTVGLSRDDRGLLAWYKEVNPTGIILSMDLHIPSYLDSEDYFLEGDCQEILPKLSEIV